MASREVADRSIDFLIGRSFLRAALILTGGYVLVLAWFRMAPNAVALAAGAAALGSLALSPIVHKEFDRAAAAGSFELWSAFCVFVAYLAFYGVTMFSETPYNEQVRQALAFLHGHTYIDAPDSFLEHAQVGPYSYALHPPLPAIALMPIVAILGMQTNQTACSVIIGAIDIALAWRLIGKISPRTGVRVWLTAFFGTGTILWYETVIGTTWALPMLFGVTFTLAVLSELFGDARPTRVGLYAALASLARYDLVLAMPIYVAMASLKGRKPK